MCFYVVGGDIDGSSIHNVNGERLTWDPPEFPQGMIIHYEVLVNGSTFTTPTNEIDINSLDLAPGVHFIQVCNIVCVLVCVCCVCVCVCVHVCMYICVCLHMCVRVSIEEWYFTCLRAAMVSYCIHLVYM